MFCSDYWDWKAFQSRSSFNLKQLFFHFSSAGSGNSNANHTTSLNNATANAVPHSRNNLNRKVRSPPLGSPTGYTSNGYFGGNFYGGGRFAENLPEYRHEPPKTPPHILLHYSTFKVQAIQKVLKSIAEAVKVSFDFTAQRLTPVQWKFWHLTFLSLHSVYWIQDTSWK